MKGLKIVLWLCALCCLSGFVFAALPWRMLIACYQWCGFQVPTEIPLTVYMIRIFSATYGFIGIFFLILALNPLKYGAMLLLAGYGTLCMAVFCLVGGIWYSLPFFMYLFDFIFCGVFGVLILVFRKNALQAQSSEERG